MKNQYFEDYNWSYINWICYFYWYANPISVNIPTAAYYKSVKFILIPYI
jgi:hypothetical protein